MINQTINTEARPVPEQLLQYFQTSEHMVINTHNWAKENTQCMVSHPAGLQTPGIHNMQKRVSSAVVPVIFDRRWSAIDMEKQSL
jgi:hypothetical protein